MNFEEYLMQSTHETPVQPLASPPGAQSGASAGAVYRMALQIPDNYVPRELVDWMATLSNLRLLGETSCEFRRDDTSVPQLIAEVQPLLRIGQAAFFWVEDANRLITTSGFAHGTREDVPPAKNAVRVGEAVLADLPTEAAPEVISEATPEPPIEIQPLANPSDALFGGREGDVPCS